MDTKIRRLTLIVAWLLAPLALRAAEPGPGADDLIPREGLVLWLTAEDAVVDAGNVARLKDRSGKHNDAVREKDPKIVAGNPVIATHEAAHQPVLRFSGAFTGYEFTAITNARTVFLVVSKHPAAFKKFNERFVLGGKVKSETDYHVGCHWTDVITEGQFNRHGKTWFNGLPCDAGVSEFSTKLAVISFVAGRDTTVAQLARDREFLDRSWHGDIGEVLVYTTCLSDLVRQKVEASLLKKYGIEAFPPVVVPRETVLPGHTKPPAGEEKR